MAPPPSTPVSPVVALVVRVITLVSLLVALILLATNTTTTDVNGVQVKSKFNAFYAYRYLLATTVLGMVYTLLQIAFTVYFVSTGNRLGGHGLILFDFYGDKVFSYILATGAAAGFGVTVDTQQLVEGLGGDSGLENFLNKGNAAAGLVFVGFLFSAVSSVFSSLCLPKTP